MQCYSELLPPTAVSHAISLPFLKADATNLIVAKTSLLQVFNIETGTDPSREEERLVLVGEYPLAGTVVGLARVKLPDTRSGGQALLLSFKNAKLSLIEWDPENYRTSIISVHYYEGDNITRQPFGPAPSECESILTVDPESRCAALKFGAKHLAILPFRQFGDDLVGEEEDGFETEQKKEQTLNKLGNGEGEQTPYKASFVLPLTTLDPNLTHPIHLAFLHEYREPTFGILSAPIAPSDSLLAERKDILTFTVFTVDLEQRASTNLITVPKLPSSLWKVVPLPLPIGGALLVGVNEFVHVDQSGKTNAVAVNEFAKLGSALGMSDQSELNLRLEDCEVEVLDAANGALLVILQDGSLVILGFEMHGRSIASLKVSRVLLENDGNPIDSSPSCLTKLGKHSVFIGSEDGPSALLGWKQPTTVLSRKRSHGQANGQDREDEDEEDIEEDDDDLYQAAPPKKRREGSVPIPGHEGNLSYQFVQRDSLPSLGPIKHICPGRPKGADNDRLELLASSGRRGASRLTCLTRTISPLIVGSTGLENVHSAWAVRAVPDSAPDEIDQTYDNLLFVYDGQNTDVYDITFSSNGESEYSPHTSSEFERYGETIDISLVANNTRIVQVRRNEIRVYDADLSLNQIIPMVDDETDAEYNITHFSSCDPYMLVIRNDKSVVVLQRQRKEIEPLEGEGVITEKKWSSGCIYADSLTKAKHTLFLLSSEGSLHAFSLPDLQQVHTIPALPLLPPILSADATHKRTGVKENLTELLIADLGQDGLTQSYMILRTDMDDIIFYEPFYPEPNHSDEWQTGIRFRKVPSAFVPRYRDVTEDDRTLALKVIQIGNYRAVCVPGAPPSLILKEPAFLPQMLEMRATEKLIGTCHLSPLHREGFTMIDGNGNLSEYRLPSDTWYGSGWAARQINLGMLSHELDHISYHDERGLYIVSSSSNVDFHFSTEDARHQEQDDINMRPQIPQCNIHLVSSATNDIIHTFDLPFFEAVTAVKVMTLEVSENTYERKPRIVVSTAALRGEDMPARGALMIFDIIDVVPEPGRRESGVKLHLVSREETKGAITAIDVFPGGLIGTAQGQKVMVRGLKEDGSCLPVAFLDGLCHMTSIKSFGHSGLWLLGDVWKGLWFGGFTEEPYKLTVLGKSRTQLEVVTADFLPFDGQLFLLVADADTNLHILQYDPENPKTVSGMRLLLRSAFHLGHFPTTMTLLPSTLNSDPSSPDRVTTNGDDGTPFSSSFPPPQSSSSSSYQVLTTSQTGSIGLITPLDEASYRRLSALNTHLASVLEHTAALNPRAYRAVEGVEGERFGGGAGSTSGTRGNVVDGTLVRRAVELGATRRADVLSRSGGDAWTLRADLEMIKGGGLGYL